MKKKKQSVIDSKVKELVDEELHEDEEYRNIEAALSIMDLSPEAKKLYQGIIARKRQEAEKRIRPQVEEEYKNLEKRVRTAMVI